MIDKIKQYKQEFKTRITEIGLSEELRQLRTDFLGKKGRVTQVLKDMRELSSEQKREVGRHVNELKNWIENEIREKTEKLKSTGEEGADRSFDPTLSGRREPRGTLHPITQVMEEIIAVFVSLGFQVAEGPEVESDYYNFEALNIPKDHPARDMQDTFYIGGEKVLRTHTSPVQIHVMEHQPPPLRIIAPGKVYRCDSDISHTPMFHQIEGLMVDETVTFGDLKGVMNIFLHQIFGEKTEVRFRPSFFPFTCPSAEVDIQCVMCRGKGCRVCSQTGWIEILGCGMVDPAVFGFVDYDAERWKGFAFGMGIERIAMLLYGISDIRLLFENDLRFLKQF